MFKLFLLLIALSWAFPAWSQSAPPRLFAIRDGKKWGFINRDGRVVTAPRFDEVGTRAEGVWPVRDGKKWGFVAEKSARLAIEPRFESVNFFSEGLCAAVAGGKIGYIGLNGKWQIAPRFVVDKEELDSGLWALKHRFADGLAPAQIGENEAAKRGYRGTWGFIDRKGNWKIAPRFSDAEAMSDGMARVTLETGAVWGEDGYVSSAGQFVALPKGASGIWSEPFYEGLAVVAGPRDARIGRRTYGFIDKSGKWAIAPRFIEVLFGGDPLEGRIGFKDGLATVIAGTTPQNVRVGWIDKRGKWAIEPRFNGGGSGFVAGLTPAREGEKMGAGQGGFIDKSGAFVIAPQFEKMGVFSSELAPVKKSGERWGYINQSGATIIAPRFDYVPLEQVITPDMIGLQFRDGLAYVKEGATRGYINARGQWKWKERPEAKASGRGPLALRPSDGSTCRSCNSSEGRKAKGPLPDALASGQLPRTLLIK